MRYRYCPEWGDRWSKKTMLTYGQVKAAVKRSPGDRAGRALKDWMEQHRSGALWFFVDRGDRVKPENRYWLGSSASWATHFWSLENQPTVVKRFQELAELVESW